MWKDINPTSRARLYSARLPEQVGDKMRKVFDIVTSCAVGSAGCGASGRGMQFAVDAAARKVITDAGYGPDYKYFTHRPGPRYRHGRPRKFLPCAGQRHQASSANMTFSDEPGIYIRGEFGVRLEDDMHITENGAERSRGSSVAGAIPSVKPRRHSSTCGQPRAVVHNIVYSTSPFASTSAIAVQVFVNCF